MDATNQIQTQTPTLPLHPIESGPKPSFPLWGAAVIAILVGSGVLLTWRSLNQSPRSPLVPTPTPSQIPTPTPIRKLSRIASDSAFLTIETQVASFSSQLRTFVIDDPSLSPPVLELPLGF